MKILVTGCAGFIASHLIEELLSEKNKLRSDFVIDRIVGVDNFATGREDNMDSFKDDDRFDFYKLDIAELMPLGMPVMEDLFNKFEPDVIVHAAAAYKDPDDWVEDCRVNVYGTSILVKLAKKYGVKRIVYFQTSLCYGLKPLEQPITLNHPIRPEGSTYAITKTACEDLMKMSGIDYVSLRLANCYGPRNLSGPVPTFFQRLSAGQPCFVMNTRRDFIFVKDLVEVAFKATIGKGSGGAYHVATGSDYAIKELYDAMRNAMGMEPADVEVRERNPDDVATILLDPIKTAEEFDWVANTKLSAGIAEAVEWYKTHEFGETFTHLKSVKD